MKKAIRKADIWVMFLAPEVVLIVAMIVSGLIYLFLN